MNLSSANHGLKNRGKVEHFMEAKSQLQSPNDMQFISLKMLRNIKRLIKIILRGQVTLVPRIF